MSDYDKQIFAKVEEILDREHRYHTSGYDGVVGFTPDDRKYFQSILAQHREAVEREARIDELEKFEDDPNNQGYYYTGINGNVLDRLNQLKQQPELQEESDDE